MMLQIYELILSSLFFGTLSAITALTISPLQFVKIIRQETGKLYMKIVVLYLKEQGIKVFFRGAIPYTVMQFISSMSFGVTDYLSNLFLNNTSNFVSETFIRAGLGGVFETIVTIYYELKEITRNKGELIHSKPSISSIIIPVCFRNTIFWCAAIIAYQLSLQFSLTTFTSLILAFTFGIVFALFSIPFDVVATQSCGAYEKMCMLTRLHKIILERGKTHVFAGSLIRIIQIAIFSTVTELSMMLFQLLRMKYF